MSGLFRFQPSNRAEQAESGVGFSWDDGDGQPQRQPHQMPAVVLEQWRDGAISGASWCRGCPAMGCADPACCAYEIHQQRLREERDRVYRNIARPPAEGRKGWRLGDYLRSRKRPEHV